MTAGEQVQVLSLNKQYEDKAMTETFNDVAVRRVSLPFLSLINFADKILRKLHVDFSYRYYWQGKKLRRIAADYDIIHSHYIQVDHLIATLKKDFAFKHIVTVHGDYSAQYDSYKKGELRFWLNFDKKLEVLAAHVDQWVVVSEEQKRFLGEIMNIPANRVRKIYNGYPAASNRETADNNTVFTVGMVARGTPQKGWQLLINAFLKLPPNTKLLLVGGGKYINELKIKYASEKRIIFTGFQADPIGWMRQMDVFVLPTLYPFESLPNVITEALSCHLPVVATNVGEIEEMITDKSTGQKAGFVIDFDGKTLNEDQLYEKLKYIYGHPEQAKEMRSIAGRAAMKFDMQKCVDSYVKLYRETKSL